MIKVSLSSRPLQLTPFRMSHVNGTPPWFAIGPVFDRFEHLAGVTFSVGSHCLAIHRAVH